MNPFKDNTIQKRVMAVVKERISLAQKEYEDGCKNLDDELEKAIRVAENHNELEKVSLADKLVDSIVGKIL